MSLKSICSEFARNVNDLGLMVAKHAALGSDEERFRFNYKLFRDNLNNYSFKRVGKCKEKSQALRETGNKYFRKNELWKAIDLYSESLAYAPNSSPELSLALGNRAAALLRLSFAKEALTDVERALTIYVSQSFTMKLLQRKEQCLQCCESSPPFLKDLEDVAISKSDSFLTSASSVVNIKTDNSYGRSLVAGSDVHTGEILVVEKPFSSTLILGNFYTYCSGCFRRNLNLMPCQNCSTSMYCSEECQNRSKQCHRVECEVLEILNVLQAASLELLSFKVLSDASGQGQKLDQLATEIFEYDRNNNKQTSYNSEDHINIYNLIGNTEKRTAEDLFHKSLVACIILTLLEKFTDFFALYSGEKREHLIGFAGGLLLRYLQSMPCNAHEISEYVDNDYKEIGAGVYATLSLTNHSCDPNVVRHCYRDVIVLRAIRPIKKGQQLFDNYGYHYALLSLHERQTSLLQQYYFQCQCEACLKDWPLYKHLPDNEPQFKQDVDVDFFEKLTEAFKENFSNVISGESETVVIEDLTKYLDFLSESVERPWKPYNVCQEAIKHCLGLRGNCFRLSKAVGKLSG